MEEKDKLQWSKLFQDKPIPKTTLENFQSQLMAKIIAHPVDFGAEISLATRRKWGLGLALSLIFAGLMFWIVLWLGSDMFGQWLNVPEIQQFEQGISQMLVSLKNLKTGIYLLWGTVSWPMMGILCMIVVFRNPNYLKSKSTN